MALSALDLLFQNDDDQSIIRCLTRKPKQTMMEIAQFVKLPHEKVENIVVRLVRDSTVVQQQHNGQSVYSVCFAFEQSGKARNSPSDLLSLFD